MQLAINRRTFLRFSTAALALVPAGGVALEPFKRAGAPRLLLSLAAYSFRDYFKDASRGGKPGTDPARRLDLFQFVDYCADHGCAGTELTSYYFPSDLNESFLVQLRRHCFLRGVEISGTAVGNTFVLPAGEKRDEQLRYVRQWVDYAAVLGAPHIRVFAGTSPKTMPLAEAKKLCIAGLEESADYAGRKGIFLGLENHGGIVAEADDLLEILRAVQSPWVGINLDSGNFQTDDPYHDFARCAPYAVNVQIKAEIQRHGQKQEEADLGRLLRILRDANYQGYVALEYESAEDPWKAVPRLLQKLKALCSV